MMHNVSLLLTAAGLSLFSGLPGLFLSRHRGAGQRIACGVSILASLAGLAGALPAFCGGSGSPVVLGWRLMGERVSLAVDPLSAFFLVPVLLMSSLGAVYGLGYWPQGAHAGNGRKLSLFWGVLNAGMILLLLARHTLLFLFGWELMALAAFFLVSTEDHVEDVFKAGWIYLVATHVGTLALFALFSLLAVATDSFTMQAVASGAMGRGMALTAFLLMFTGFGLKAGVMPLHFWLPGAHANAPSHVSAMLSGIVLKTGIYGLVRFSGYLPDLPMVCGVFVLVAGCVSGVLGVVFAIAQHDLKRLLAYHSIENIGIILMGLGLAMIGRSADRPLWVVLGMAGCLLHVWNHGLFKTLLFFGAGSVIHAAGTRQIDRMGGLAGPLPWTAAFFLAGAVAICGLPPLNGFVSEWFVYLGLFHAVADNTASAWPVAALAAPVLAIIGGLALACFVKAYGAVFLGQPRYPLSTAPHESPLSMRIPMGILGGLCVMIGVFPWVVVPVLDRTIAAWDGALLLSPLPLGSLAPLSAITLSALALAGVCTLVFWGLVRQRRHHVTGRAMTWSCGYARPTPRMQYTAASFAQMLTGLWRAVLGPRIHLPRIRTVFAGSARYESHQDDPVLDRTLLPAGGFIKALFSRARPLQRGLINLYLLYVAFTVIVLLVWTMPIRAMVERLFAL
jgi:hydrogenase-4 component B